MIKLKKYNQRRGPVVARGPVATKASSHEGSPKGSSHEHARRPGTVSYRTRKTEIMGVPISRPPTLQLRSPSNSAHVNVAACNGSYIIWGSEDTSGLSLTLSIWKEAFKKWSGTNEHSVLHVCLYKSKSHFLTHSFLHSQKKSPFPFFISAVSCFSMHPVRVWYTENTKCIR